MLQDTVDQYNEFCRCGVDNQFHKDQKFLHELTGKGGYIVGKFYLGAYGTVGGVRINKYCEVLNEDRIDPVFRAAAECTEEAVLNSMTAAEDVTGPNGVTRLSLVHFARFFSAPSAR